MADDKKPPLSRAADFLTHMDARAWRAAFATILMFAVVGVILVIGRLYFGDEIAAGVERWLGGAEKTQWGLPAAILVFTLGAFLGVPQFVLIAACVVAFGPEVGFWWSWIATIASGAVTFFIGKAGGGKLRVRYAGATGGRFTKFMKKNGFLASLLVRLVPSGPFIVVNMAMATAGVGFLPFVGGLALGSLPKSAIVAFAGDGIMDALEGNVEAAVGGAVAALVIWFLLVYLTRRFVQRDGE